MIQSWWLISQRNRRYKWLHKAFPPSFSVIVSPLIWCKALIQSEWGALTRPPHTLLHLKTSEQLSDEGSVFILWFRIRLKAAKYQQCFRKLSELLFRFDKGEHFYLCEADEEQGEASRLRQQRLNTALLTPSRFVLSWLSLWQLPVFYQTFKVTLMPQ